MNLASAKLKIGAFIAINAPKILAGVGVGAFVGAVVSSAKVSPVAKEKVEDILVETRDKKRRAERVIKEVAPMYGPTIALVGVGVVATVRSQMLWSSRTADLMELTDKLAGEIAAYSVSERALRTYQDKVIERLGSDTHEDILQSIAEKSAEETFIESPDGLRINPKVPVQDFIPGEGEYLVYDTVMNQLFWSTPEKLDAAKGAMSSRLLDEYSATLNDFYSELGLPGCGSVGNALGWTTSPAQRPNLYISSTLNPDGKMPKLAIEYSVFNIGCGECLNAW